jgi:glycosyltransferase involved in cell wall biosynthesis
MDPLPRISFVVPARNEERLLGGTLESIRIAASAVGQAWEVVVVDDDSQDRTAEIARANGARVIPVKLHNIGAVRNAGAREARGEVLVFLDADTQLPVETLRALLAALEAGAVGGGGWVRFDSRITWFQSLLAKTFCYLWLRFCGWAAGCFIFARRVDFDSVGGFDETYFCAEERYLSVALKSRGRFVILREGVITSARKLRLYSTANLIWIAVRTLLLGPQRLKQREGLEILYDAPREA